MDEFEKEARKIFQNFTVNRGIVKHDYSIQPERDERASKYNLHTRLILVCQSATSSLSFSLLVLKQRVNRIFIFHIFQRALRAYSKNPFLSILFNIFRLFHVVLKDNFRYQDLQNISGFFFHIGYVIEINSILVKIRNEIFLTRGKNRKSRIRFLTRKL